MTTLFRTVAGIDFDDYFDLNKSGEYAANVNHRTADGTDLARRYELLKYGSRAADVRFRNAAGVDLAAIWAAKGTAVYALGFNGKYYESVRTALTNENTTISASVGLVILANGTWAVNAASGSPTTGTWLPAGKSASEYTVQIVVANSGAASVSNSAASYVAATGSPGATITASVPGNSVKDVDVTASFTLYLRHSSGTVTTSSLTAHVRATGYL